jgi:methionyl-tRNA formyltransferase
VKFDKIAILTTKRSWFTPFAKNFVKDMIKQNMCARLFYDHNMISDEYDIVFMISYFKVVPRTFLIRHKYVLVVHESGLPKGRGWAPLFWQILKGRNRIPIVLFHATKGIDEGDIYLKDYITLHRHELHDEIRKKQAEKSVDLCFRFFSENIKSKKQVGKPSFYRRRTPLDSELDVNKTLKQNFNLLRIVDNDRFPAFFHHRGKKYIIKVYKSRNQ